MADGARLEVEGIALAFGGLSVLRGISFDAAPGELLAVIGPNGAGKTSALNCVSGVYRPSAGRIRFDGRDITSLRPHHRAAAGIARTFQHGELFRQLNVVENLLVARHAQTRGSVLADGLFLGAARRREIAEREAVEAVIEFVELERYRGRLVGSLPFGMQKIVGFARALAARPRLLLLDEPTAGLTREEKEDVARFILRIKHELGVTMVWVEHDMQMVADLADRIVVLDFGEKLADGASAQVLADPRVIAAYLGTGHSTRAVGSQSP